MSDCPKCKRPRYRGDFDFIGECSLEDSHQCQIAEAAYRRGVADAIEMAKEYAELGPIRSGGHPIDWADVDAEAAKLTGGAQS